MIEDIYDRYEIDGRPFKTRYKGTCTLDDDHPIKVNDLVARVIRKDNPALPVGGVICKKCVAELRL